MGSEALMGTDRALSVELGVVDPVGRVLQCAMYISPAVVACLASNLILLVAPSLLCPSSLHSFLCAFCATFCLSFNRL